MDIWGMLKLVLETLAGNVAVVGQALSWVVAVMGTARLILKPVMVALQSIVDSTQTPADNEWLKKLQESKFYKTLSFILDYVFSIKLPPKKV
jgi:hypothetical protein